MIEILVSVVSLHQLLSFAVSVIDVWISTGV
jgi:hypothetical protein